MASGTRRALPPACRVTMALRAGRDWGLDVGGWTTTLANLEDRQGLAYGPGRGSRSP